MSEEGDRVMKLQRKVKEAKKNARVVKHERHMKKLDRVLVTRGIKL